MQNDQGDPNVNSGDDVFVAPPDAAGFDSVDLEPPPAWPKVVGIISIVLGALNECCGVIGAGGLLMQATMMQGAFDDGLPPTITDPPMLVWALMVLGFFWAALLIFAGVMSVSRKAVARKLHLIWAVGGIVLTLLSVYYQLDGQEKLAQWVADNPDTKFAEQMSLPGANIGAYLGMFVTLVIGLPWPAFCLIWFGIAKKRPEVGAEEAI